MKGKKFIMLFIVSLLVIALGASVTAAAAQTSVTSTAAQAPSNTFFIPVVDKSSTAGTASRSSISSPSTAAPAPQLSAPKLLRDKVFIDYSQSKIVRTATNPNKVDVYLVGNLPDPCHILRISQITATSSNAINLDVYSLYDPTLACVTVLKPFSVTYSLGSFSPGIYTVYINGIKLGTFGVSGSVSSTFSR